MGLPRSHYGLGASATSPPERRPDSRERTCQSGRATSSRRSARATFRRGRRPAAGRDHDRCPAARDLHPARRDRRGARGRASPRAGGTAHTARRGHGAAGTQPRTRRGAPHARRRRRHLLAAGHHRARAGRHRHHPHHLRPDRRAGAAQRRARGRRCTAHDPVAISSAEFAFHRALQPRQRTDQAGLVPAARRAVPARPHLFDRIRSGAPRPWRTTGC